VSERLGASLFYVDLARCTGCDTCIIACKDRANLPDDVDWVRVERTELGCYPDVRVTFRVIHCFHCARPACLDACPVAAITRDTAGWVQIDASLCTGCAACVLACPFCAIALGGDGLASKCDGCVDEVAAGVGPTCVRACPMRALFYAPAAEVNRPRVQAPDWDDHGIAPRVWYGVRSEGDTPHD
jgi:anaerobic dimethyl sulfoxide reductase subunit B (iron-sulfur subunit)